MTTTLPVLAGDNHIKVLRLAREIAMEIRDLPDILKTHGISQAQWNSIRESAEFQRILHGEVEAWHSAVNTSDRVKLKSMSFIEEALPEFFGRAHDPKEALSSKVELLKTIAKLAGLGNSNVETSGGGEKFSVTINLGADQSVRIEKEVTSKVIDHQEQGY